MATVAEPSHDVGVDAPLPHPEVPHDDALSETHSLKTAVTEAGNQGSLNAAGGGAHEPTIIKRKLNGFVGFSNLPQQWHQKSIRKGFNLNVMAVGESGLGKSTLLNTLFETELHPLQPRVIGGASRGAHADVDGGDDHSRYSDPSRTVSIVPVSADLEENGVRLHLTLIDTPGFGDHVNNLDSWKPIVDEVDRRNEQYVEAESSMNRTNVRDNRVHALLYFIEPTGHSLKPLDIVVMKKLHKKVNLIPIIAKADTLTEEELVRFKQLVLEDIRFQGIDIFYPPVYDDDDEEQRAETIDVIQRVPFAVVGSTQVIATPDGRHVYGRAYPWGVIEVNNEDQNDFVKLRALLIRDHLEDLRETTSNLLYENYRTDKLLQLGIQQDSSVFREVNPALRQEEERAQHEERLAKMENEMRAVFQQKVTEKEMKLKKSEAELFARHKDIKEQLERNRAELEAKKAKLEQAIHANEDKKRRGFSLR